jgi:hypothetical protein
MNRSKGIWVTILAGLLFVLSIISASAEADPEAVSVSEDETGLIAQEIELNLNFLESMLQMLDINLNLINETLNSHLEEFPFLQPTIEGTAEGIKTVDSLLVVLELSPNDMSDSNVTLHSLNATLAQINSSIMYPDLMIESANSTMGDADNTTPIIGNMFTSVKGMVSLLEQF